MSKVKYPIDARQMDIFALLMSPLPAACAAGDAFTAYAGCDKQQATCSTKFSNVVNFKGHPYIPVPETAY